MEKTQHAKMIDALKKYQNGIGLINYITFLVFLFLLPMPWHFVQPVWVIWLIAWALEGRWMQKENFSFSKKITPQLLIIIFIAWEALSLLWTSDVNMGRHDLSKHYYFGAILLISLFGVNERYNSTAMKIALCLGSVVAVIGYSMISIWVTSNDVQGWLPNINTAFPRLSFSNFVGGEHICLIKHHLYLATVLIIALCFSPDIYQRLKDIMRIEYAIATIIICDLIIFFGILASNCRIAIFLLPTLPILCIYAYYKGNYRTTALLGAIVAALVALGVLYASSERLRSSFDNIHIDYNEQRATHVGPENNARPYIWHTVIKHLGDYGIKGYGLGSEELTMNKYYEEDEQDICRLLSFNAHSTYLSTWIQLGPLAMLWLIFIIVSMPHCFPKEQRSRISMTCFIIAAIMLTETILWRMSGLYIIFALLLLSQPYKLNSNE